MRKNKKNLPFITQELTKIFLKKKTMLKTAKYLGTSRQTIAKWCQELKKHKQLKPKVHKAINKIPNETNDLIISNFNDYLLKIQNRFGKNNYWLPTLRYFKTRFSINTSVEHIRKLLIKNNFVTHRTQRKTKKRIKQNIQNSLKKIKNEDQFTTLKEKFSLISSKIYSGKTGLDGQRIEVDGCFDHWFGNDKYCLYFAVDYFSGTLLSLHIEKEETNVGYLNLFKYLFKKHGKPLEVRTDKRNGLAQGAIYDALARIDINIASSSQATFKPNVERAFQTAQSFFPLWFMDNNINSPKELLEKRDLAIAKYNEYSKKHMIEDNCLLPMSQKEIDNFTIQTKRKVVNQISHVNINGKAMAPFDGNKRILLKNECIVHNDENNNLFIKKFNKKYWLKKINNIIESPYISKMRTDVQKNLYKQKTYKKIFYKKVKEVNNIIYLLNKKGSNMEPLHFDL